jgi:hypothetical protein
MGGGTKLPCYQIASNHKKTAGLTALNFQVKETCSAIAYSSVSQTFSSGDHFYQSECSTDHPTLVRFESKLFEILNYSVWYAIHVNFIFSVFFGLMFTLRGTTRAEPEDQSLRNAGLQNSATHRLVWMAAALATRIVWNPALQPKPKSWNNEWERSL